MGEDGITFDAKGAFYNPEMRLCRSVFSLAVGAIGEKIKLLDAFCASGIRGIRYAKENKNVGKVVFLDWSKNAIKIAKKNAAKNRIKKAEFVNEDVNRFLINNFYEDEKFGFDFNFIELDPFGTPAPYLYPSFFSMQKKKIFYLSATATDTAVLCGHEGKACLKNYHSKNLNNEFTHETGLRILIKRAAETAAEFNFAVTPLFSLSDRHYLKTLVKCENNGNKADECMKNLGFISHCSCGWRNAGKRITNRCGRCGKEPDYGGLLWLDEINDKRFVTEMGKLNAKRNYEDKEEIEKIIKLIKNEISFPPWYYNIHKTCERIRSKSVPKTEKVMEILRKNGFRVVKTRFSSVSLKTDAGIEDFEISIRDACNK